MVDVTRRFITVGQLRMHIAEAGSGPLAILLHGFPESSHSWRHQLTALADSGFHAVAPDQRGYGRTDRPGDVAAYTILHLVGDVVGLITGLGENRAVVVGHDWGASVAWHTALMRPDLVRGVAGLSVPYLQRTSRPPIELMRETIGEGYYVVYFQRPGVAEAELERDVPATFRRILAAGSGEGSAPGPIVPPGRGFLDLRPEPNELPGWLTEEDIAHFAEQFVASGFAGPLNWYRNFDRNWDLTTAWQDALITPPALFIAGDRDPVLAGPGAKEIVQGMRDHMPNLRETIELPGCGHWTQQERPDEVNDGLIGFLRDLR